MNPRPRRSRLGLCLLAGLCVLAGLGCAQLGGERVLGATEIVHVPAADLDFLAIVDTGAFRTSIHALDIRIPDAETRMRDNVGKPIEFLLVNERGRGRRVRSTVADVLPVRTSHGTEWRYVVPLRLRWRDVEKEVLVNLRDRTPMTYKLLLGRDFLKGDFVVDVSRNAVD
jgi:hypothetical protein